MVPIENKCDGNNLAKVLHYYGLLEDRNNYKIICPFHEDINPSMIVDLNDGLFYCFGCNVSGDAFKFVQLANPKLDDLQACIKYHKILKSKKVQKIKVKTSTSCKRHADDKQSLIEAMDYYFGLRTVSWDKENCDEKEYMMKRGFTPDVLNKCKAKVTYNQSYPIIFPMFDMGTFRGWVCRTNNPLIEKKRKYLYNTGFRRNDTLVGDYNAKTVVLVEGYMDRLKMLQFGLNKVVAILGWKITDNQIAKLKEQNVKCIISALDTDKSGRKGTEYLKKYFKVIEFNFPPGVKDPGEMTQKQFNVAFKKTKQKYRRSKEYEFS